MFANVFYRCAWRISVWLFGFLPLASFRSFTHTSLSSLYLKMLLTDEHNNTFFACNAGMMFQ